MDSLPSLELLEANHTFPCPYQFKVIGRVENGFIGRVVAAVREELEFAVDPAYSVREARGGRHVAVTLEPMLPSAEHVLAVYRRLGALEGLVLLW
jgi:putative lipoic acid-binding regulatory protein